MQSESAASTLLTQIQCPILLERDSTSGGTLDIPPAISVVNGWMSDSKLTTVSPSISGGMTVSNAGGVSFLCRLAALIRKKATVAKSLSE